MTSQYRHRRTSTPATPFPTLEPGEIAVNTANRQISVGDAATPTLGTPKPLLAIRFFDSAAIYAIGDIVTSADKIWRAIVANGPGAFNAAQWELAASQVTISSNPPSNAVAGSMWWDSDNGMLYVRYNDGDSSQWVQATAMPVVDTTAFVTKTGDTMSGHLSLPVTPAAANAVRKDYVDAADTALRAYADARVGDALAYSGMQINGGGEVSQELGAIGLELVSGGLKYIADNWQAIYVNSGGAVTAAQFAAVGFPAPLPGFRASVGLVATTALSSPVNNDFAMLRHAIEGTRIARLAWGTANAQPLTYGAYVYVTNAGTMFSRIVNSVVNRAYHREHVLLTGWNWITATIPGDITGTWPTDNTAGIIIDLFCAGKAASPITPNSWSGTAANQTTGSSQNLLSTTTSRFYVTGFVVLPGTQAPTAAQSPLLMRSYDQELATCKRYWQQVGIGAVGSWTTASDAQVSLQYSVEFRGLPTISLTTTTPGILEPGVALRTGVGSAVAINYNTVKGSLFSVSGFSGATLGKPALITADYVKLDARL